MPRKPDPRRVDALVDAELSALTGEMMDARHGAIAKRKQPTPKPDVEQDDLAPAVPQPKKDGECPQCGGDCPPGQCYAEEGAKLVGGSDGGPYVGRDAHGDI